MRHARPLLALLILLSPCTPTTAQDPTPVTLREQAYGAYNDGDFAAAADAFLKLVERAPDNPTWVVEAGDCLGRSGRFADAIDLLDQARRKFPGLVDIPAMLARTLLLQSERDAGALDPDGLIAQAAEIAEQVLRLDPDHEDCRLILAQARYLLGDWDEAVRQAEEAARRHPERAGAHILRGRIATDRMLDLLREHRKGGLEGRELADLVAAIDAERRTAKAEFRRAAELDPNRAHPHVMLARLAEIDRRDADVVRHLKDALAIDPDTRIDHARVRRGLDWKQQASLYAELLTRYGARPDATDAKRATLRWYEGLAFYEGSQWPKAREAFEQAYAWNPKAFHSLYYAAFAAYRVGDYDAAGRHAGDYARHSAKGFADIVRHLDPERRGQTAAILRFLADRAYRSGRLAESRDLNHVLALLQDSAEAWNNYAFLCRETDRFDDALDAYERALRKEPSSPQLLNDAGVILQYHLTSERNLERARAFYRKAIECAEAVLADRTASSEAKEQARASKSDARKNLAAMK